MRGKATLEDAAMVALLEVDSLAEGRSGEGGGLSGGIRSSKVADFPRTVAGVGVAGSDSSIESNDTDAFVISATSGSSFLSWSSRASPTAFCDSIVLVLIFVRLV